MACTPRMSRMNAVNTRSAASPTALRQEIRRATPFVDGAMAEPDQQRRRADDADHQQRRWQPFESADESRDARGAGSHEN